MLTLEQAIKIKHEPFSSSAKLKQIKGTFAEKRGAISFKKHALLLAAAKNTAREIKVSLSKINVFIKRRKKMRIIQATDIFQPGIFIAFYCALEEWDTSYENYLKTANNPSSRS